MRRIDVNIMHLYPSLRGSKDHQTVELQLLKPGLLYGDHIRLFSPNSYIEQLRKSRTWDTTPLELKVKVAEQILDNVATSDIAPGQVENFLGASKEWLSANRENYSHFLRTGQILGNCGHFLRVDLVLSTVMNTLLEVYREELPGADAIIRLCDLDLVSIHSPADTEDLVDAPDLELPLKGDAPQEVIEAASIISKRIWKIWNTQNAFPLFDETVGFWAEQLFIATSSCTWKGLRTAERTGLGI